MAKEMAAQMLMQRMASKEPESGSAAKPKFGSPEWRAMYGKKKKKMP